MPLHCINLSPVKSNRINVHPHMAPTADRTYRKCIITGPYVKNRTDDNDSAEQRISSRQLFVQHLTNAWKIWMHCCAYNEVRANSFAICAPKMWKRKRNRSTRRREVQDKPKATDTSERLPRSSWSTTRNDSICTFSHAARSLSPHYNLWHELSVVIMMLAGRTRAMHLFEFTSNGMPLVSPHIRYLEFIWCHLNGFIRLKIHFSK